MPEQLLIKVPRCLLCGKIAVRNIRFVDQQEDHPLCSDHLLDAMNGRITKEMVEVNKKMPEQLSTTEILLIVNTILTTIIPLLTSFLMKIRKSKCIGRFCSCDVERDTEDSPLITKKKNAFSSQASINTDSKSPLVQAKPIR